MSSLSPLQVDEVRQIPLESILAYHGLTPRREGSTTRYKNEPYNIVVGQNGLWFDNAASLGGRGAIDLILHLKYQAHPRLASDRDFREAVDWLAGFQPNMAVMRAKATVPQPAIPKESFACQMIRLAIRDDARWTLARNYLTQVRRLPSHLVDQFFRQGEFFASFSEKRPEETGVCFIHRNLAGEACGATIRTTASRSSSFSIGEKQSAWFTLGHPLQAKRAILVEAPIDAISYSALKCPEGAVVLAMSCSHVFRSILQAAHERLWLLTVGFDNDRAGNAGWEQCQQAQRLLYPGDPPVRRITPVAKDWNDDLRAAPRLGHGRHL